MGPPVFLFKHDAPKLMDDATLQKQARNLAGINAGKLNKANGVSAVATGDSDPTETFEQDAQGSIRFNRSLKKYAADFEPRLAPTNQVERIARKFLTDNNLMPKNEGELKVAHIGGIKANQAETNKSIEKLRTIYFSREIDGIPVIGPGSKITVNIGDRNEIQGVIHRWKEVNNGGVQGKVALKPTELKGEMEAKTEVTTRIQKDWGAKAGIKMDAPKMAYFDSNDGFIQPVYVFETVITPDGDFGGDGKGTTHKYLGMVSAMKNAPENIISETPLPRGTKTEIGKQNDVNPVGVQPDKD